MVEEKPIYIVVVKYCDGCNSETKQALKVNEWPEGGIDGWLRSMAKTVREAMCSQCFQLGEKDVTV